MNKRTLYTISVALLFGILTTAFAALEADAQLTMPVHNAAEVETKVREVFADAPEMVAMAQCESKFRQYTDSGAPLRGGNNRQYIGVFQLSENFVADAHSKGLDIYTVDGNIAYAKLLYNQRGAAPWRSCLNNASVSAPTTGGAAGNVTLTLKSGMTHAQVKLLQQLLNNNGFTVAVSGPGSKGSETNYFGALTRAAVQKFQCSQGIVCSGSESSTGYGLVGPRTKTALNTLLQ